MSMREYPVRDFIRILNKNGYEYEHNSGVHYTYSKKGCKYKVVVNHHERTVRPVIAKRLIKEGNLII